MEGHLAKTKVTTRWMTGKQWDKFVPARELAKHLRGIAALLTRLPRDARGKIKMQIQIGKPVEPQSARKQRHG